MNETTPLEVPPPPPEITMAEKLASNSALQVPTEAVSATPEVQHEATRAENAEHNDSITQSSSDRSGTFMGRLAGIAMGVSLAVAGTLGSYEMGYAEAIGVQESVQSDVQKAASTETQLAREGVRSAEPEQHSSKESDKPLEQQENIKKLLDEMYESQAKKQEGQDKAEEARRDDEMYKTAMENANRREA